MKKFIGLAGILLISASSLVASSYNDAQKTELVEPPDVGKYDVLATTVPSLDPVTMYVRTAELDFVMITADEGKVYVKAKNDLGTVALQSHVDAFRNQWRVPWCIGKADTKRHVRWRCPILKLC